MDLSRGFITTLVDEGILNEALRSGITTDFLDDDPAAIYNYIQRHYGEYRAVPSRDAVLNAFPAWEFGKYKESHEYFIHQLKEAHGRETLDDYLPQIAEAAETDLKKSEELLREALAKIQVTSKTFKDVIVGESALDRIEGYDQRKLNPGADGILSNWLAIDMQTLGWHPEEFIVLVGEKYKGKSWKMIWMAYQAALQGERVLYVTKEMSQEATVRRLDAVYAKVCFDRLRKGELTHQEEERYKTSLKGMAESNFHFAVARQGITTVEDIEAKAIETDSTIIFGDSIYLFPPDRKSNYTGETNKRLAVSQKCKEIAQRLSVPFIVSVQAGRKKSKNAEPSLDDIEWSNAFSQDADTVIYLSQDELDKELGRARLDLLKSRDGDVAKLYIERDFEFMNFEQRDDDTEPTTDVFQEDEEETLFDGEDS